MIKIYLISILVYIVSIWLAFRRLDKWLDQEYRESEEFKERIDTFTELRQDWFKDMDITTKLILILVGICPIVHWFMTIINFWLVLSPDNADAAIREAIDKILN